MVDEAGVVARGERNPVPVLDALFDLLFSLPLREVATEPEVDFEPGLVYSLPLKRVSSEYALVGTETCAMVGIETGADVEWGNLLFRIGNGERVIAGVLSSRGRSLTVVSGLSRPLRRQHPPMLPIGLIVVSEVAPLRRIATLQDVICQSVQPAVMLSASSRDRITIEVDPDQRYTRTRMFSTWTVIPPALEEI